MPVSTKPTMEELLRLVVERGASDLHLSAGIPPYLRCDERLLPTDHGPLTGEEVRELAYSLLTPEKIQRFERIEAEAARRELASDAPLRPAVSQLLER